MAHAHHGSTDLEADDVVRRAIWAAVIACGVVVALGIVLLWPDAGEDRIDPSGLAAEPVAARVDRVEQEPCGFDPLLVCDLVVLVPTEGPFEDQELDLELPVSSTVDAGDAILVEIDELEDGTVVVAFYDFQRSTPLLLLVILFVTAVVVLGRWRGVGALAGLAASLLIIIGFVLPALLAGSDAVAVALVAAGAIAFVALFLAHGITLATAAALLSTLASLAVTGLLAWGFVRGAELTGLADESVFFLEALNTPVDPRGLLLAGIVIGALGVLDDVTVTQVSAVWELRRAAPTAGVADLYRRGLRIGRDHVSSTVNTLFLAYAGAALPLLLLFREAGQSVGSVATREIVAIEIVRALVGSIGLVAAVPISTALAARVAVGARPPAAESHAADTG